LLTGRHDAAGLTPEQSAALSIFIDRAFGG